MRSRSRSWIAAGAAAVLLLVLPCAAHASSVGFPGFGYVDVSATAGVDLQISEPSAGTVRVEDFDADEDLQAATGCTETSPEIVECSGVGTTDEVWFFGSPQSDAVEVLESMTRDTELYGYGGGDVLLGGGGDDRFGGGTGSDDIDGRNGSDFAENGYDDSVVPAAQDGADVYRDTGAAGNDMLSYGQQTVGVKLLVDAGAVSGAAGEGDTVEAGFEELHGSEHADEIAGGAAAEKLSGSGGDDKLAGGAGDDYVYGSDGADDLVGGGGADHLFGNRGDDDLDAADGGADLSIQCDSAPHDDPVGTADTANADASDPAPIGCETVQGGGDGSGDGGPPPPPAAPHHPAPVGLPLGPAQPTATVSRMPRVTGQPFARARQKVLDVIPAADVDLEFRKGCRESSDLEIVRQSPITGASLPNHGRDPVAVKLTACLAERDFLRDCDLKDLRSDLRELPRAAMDAEVAGELLKGVTKCKVDYDVKLAKSAEEARIQLAAQKAAAEKAGKDAAAAKRKAELRAGISCPVPGDLRIAVTDGYTPNRRAMGLRASGPGGWTLPAKFQSFVELTVIDRALHFHEATVYVDTDDVSYKKVPPRRTVDGRVQVEVLPNKGPGKIRICVVQETGGDEVLTGAVEIRVVDRPANGTIWETVSGRRLKVTADGVALASAATAPRARAAGLGEIVDALVQLFSGVSRAIQGLAGGSVEERSVKLRDVYEGPKYGAAQISLNGALASDPAAPVVRDGPCFASRPDGTISGLRCPTLETQGGTAVVGTRLGGAGLVAAGAGNIVAAGAGNIVAAGAGNLVGPDGASLVGPDGASLVGMDGASIVAAGAGNIVAAGAGNAISIAPAQIVAAGAGNLIGPDGASIVAAGGLN